MYNDAMARAVLAERARSRDASLRSNEMRRRPTRRGIVDDLVARWRSRRAWSGRGAETPAPVLVVVEMGEAIRRPRNGRARQW